MPVKLAKVFLRELNRTIRSRGLFFAGGGETHRMKNFSLLVLFLMAGLITMAQTTSNTRRADKPFVQFGLKAGINLADVKSDLYPNHESRLGYHAGGLAHIHLSRNIALQPEVLYSSQGFKQENTSNDYTAVNNYVSIPFLIQYMQRGVRLETGPQASFLTSAKVKYVNDTEMEYKDYLKSSDISWAFGVGYLSPVGLGLDARFNLGLSNNNEKLTAPGVTNTELKNRVWQFGVFYQFPR
jgi:hypothetical protein